MIKSLWYNLVEKNWWNSEEVCPLPSSLHIQLLVNMTWPIKLRLKLLPLSHKSSAISLAHHCCRPVVSPQLWHAGRTGTSPCPEGSLHHEDFFFIFFFSLKVNTFYPHTHKKQVIYDNEVVNIYGRQYKPGMENSNCKGLKQYKSMHQNT